MYPFSWRPRMLAATAIALLATFPTVAATLFVDRGNAQCSDAGSGSASVPYCTIGKGATTAVAGDTVLVASGTYPEYVKIANSGTSSAPITIRAADGASVTVSGQSRGFEISGKSWITIRGFTVSGTISYGIYLSGASNVTVSGNRVTTAGQPVSGLTQAGIEVSSSTDCTISGNTTDHNSDSGIFVTNSSTRITVVGNVSSFNARVYTRAAPGIDVRSGGNTIRSNICHDNEDSGIQIYPYSAGIPSPNNLVVNNLCYNNGDHGIDVSSSGSQRIVGNTVYGNVSAAINVEGPSSGTLIANNISADNAINGPRSRGNIRVDSESMPGTTLDYDLVFLSQSGQVQIVWGATSYTTLASFVSANSQEAHGREADPRFVASGSGDFHLTASSPAIDSANSAASGALDTDLENHPRFDDPNTGNTGLGPPRTYDDRGCYEYQATSFCGNGVKDSGEQCDGTDLGGVTCASHGCTGGTPTCTATCTLSYSACTGCAVCGNGIKETGESCDGAALGGATCQTQGFYCATGGGLSCNSNCTFNTSACVAGSCGDGTIEAACGEACDKTALGGATCQSRGFYCGTGSGLACNSNCTFNTTSCVSGSCGDGVIQTACGETCDNTALGGATCASRGCTGGTPTCTSSCSVSYASCTGCPVCGNGIKETGEQCDGAALGGATCQTQGFYCSTGSGLSCSSNCTFNTSACVSGSCGDGVIESACGEQCDGTALGGKTCRTQGFYCSTGSGLACNASCQLNTSACVSGSCGDGVIESACGEVCDRTALGGQTCKTQGFDSGTLSCNSGCNGFNTSNCVKCNNNGVCDPGENCNGCPGDCFKSAPACGNGKCETANGEDCLTCPADCNGVQNKAKADRYCCGNGAGFGPVSCADSRCTAGGRTCSSTSTPTTCCGDGSCQGNENTSNCAVDCGP